MLTPTHINKETGSVFCIYLGQLWRKLPDRDWRSTNMSVELINNYQVIDCTCLTAKVNNKEAVLVEALRKLAWYPKYGNTNKSQAIQEMSDIAFNTLAAYGNEDEL